MKHEIITEIDLIWLMPKILRGCFLKSLPSASPLKICETSKS